MKHHVLFILFLVLSINIPTFIAAQTASVNNRTPEQEATKQTEKFQKELNLTSEQTRKIYEINLKFARERKQSGNRAEAVMRIKNKNEEIKKVLSEKQYNELQSKRTDVQSVEIDGTRTYTRTNPQNRYNNSAPTNQRTGYGSSYYRSNLKEDSYTDRPVRSSRAGNTSESAYVRTDNDENNGRNAEQARPVRSERYRESNTSSPTNRNTSSSESRNSSVQSDKNSSSSNRSGSSQTNSERSSTTSSSRSSENNSSNSNRSSSSGRR